MYKIKALTPAKRLLKARINLQKKAYFIYGILFNAKYRIATEELDFAKCPIQTAYADCEGNLVVFESFIKGKPNEFIELVLYHEAMHLVLKHPALCHGRVRDLWNIAADIKANQYASEAGYMVPGDWHQASGYNNEYSTILNGVAVRVTDCKKKSAIRIYEELIAQLRKSGTNAMSKVKQNCGTFGDNSGNGSGGNPEDDPDAEKDDSKGEGDGGDQDDDDDSDSGDDQGSGNRNGHEKQGQGSEGPVSHRGWDGKKAHERKKLGTELNEKIRTAYASAKHRGNMPAGLERIVEEILESKKDWKSLLQVAITETMPFEPSYARPDKKSFASGYYIPHVRKESVEVIVAIDTSGSIRNKELSEFRAVIIAMARQCHNINMTVLICDAKVHRVYPVKNGSIKDIMKIKPEGGGGTSHVPVYEWCKKNKQNVRLLINFTDGYTQFPNRKLRVINTLWVLTKDSIPVEDVPFGMAVKM